MCLILICLLSRSRASMADCHWEEQIPQSWHRNKREKVPREKYPHVEIECATGVGLNSYWNNFYSPRFNSSLFSNFNILFFFQSFFFTRFFLRALVNKWLLLLFWAGNKKPERMNAEEWGMRTPLIIPSRIREQFRFVFPAKDVIAIFVKYLPTKKFNYIVVDNRIWFDMKWILIDIEKLSLQRMPYIVLVAFFRLKR